MWHGCKRVTTSGQCRLVQGCRAGLGLGFGVGVNRGRMGVAQCRPAAGQLRASVSTLAAGRPARPGPVRRTGGVAVLTGLDAVTCAPATRPGGELPA
jgi:hypothetical protein